jgi:hypothetical protein
MYFFLFFSWPPLALAHLGVSLRLANARRAADVVLEFGPGTRLLTVTLLQADATISTVKKVHNICFACCFRSWAVC